MSSGLGSTHVVAIVGVDGCGKSSAFRGALESLAPQVDVVGIGDVVLAGSPLAALHARQDLPLERLTSIAGRAARRTRQGWLYRQLKSLDLIGRARMRDHVVEHEVPVVLLTDGDPLVNTMAWSASSLHRRALAGDDERLFEALSYLAGERRMPLAQVPWYLRRAWQLVLLDGLGIAHFRLPDLVVHLQLDGAEAMRRIRGRGRPLQTHETEAFLSRLGDGYERVCRLLEARCGIAVLRLDAGHTPPDVIARTVADAVLEGVERSRGPMATPVLDVPARDVIEVVATTISGSLRDQRKVGHIGPRFRARSARPVRVHAAATHAEARAITHDIVAAGGRLIVSAGGAGTFNAVLEGCHVEGGVPPDLRLAFLRKGSADLIGKMLRIPDDLSAAVAAIADGIEHDRCVAADILRVEADGPDGRAQVRHIVGFGGLGVFGEVPRFTETRMVKLYKGILSTLFGDYGPFYVGLALATLWWFAQRAIGRVPAMTLELDGELVGPATWTSVIVVNGDLGPAFPPGRGLAPASGCFRVLALRDVGLRRGLAQLAAARNGRILETPQRYACTAREVRTLVARPQAPSGRGVAASPGMINVDGLRMLAVGPVTFRLSGRVELIAGPA